MKKLIALAVCVALGGCATDKNLLSIVEMQQWSNRNDTIFHKQIPVAMFTHYEVELYKGERVNELCLQQVNDSLFDITGLIKYVHTVHPKDKVQIVSMYSILKKKYK